jgi:uncharacterized protein (DUF697 family)
MDVAALPTNEQLFPILWTASKRSAVESKIESFAIGHATMDALIGAVGFLPVPGAAPASMIAAIALQAPLIYKPLSKEIAAIYVRDEDETTRHEVVQTAIAGGVYDVAADLGAEFFKEIAGELTREAGLGFLISFIPIAGGFVSTYLDVKIAWTLTWRVGFMLALYHENGGKWVKSRRYSYGLAKKYLKLRGNDDGPQPRIADFLSSAPEVRTNQEATLSMMAKMLLESGVSKDDVARKLRERGVSEEIVTRVLSRL